MELQQRRQRRKEPKGAEDARTIHDVPDDPLRLILLRLDSPIWLIRAACACKRWRRIVTDGADQGRAFLRLASSLHPPTVVGQYHNQNSGDHRFVPSSSPIDGSRFSVNDFLDKNSRWYVADCHGGLVLLRTNYEPNAVVYDPLTRQYRTIPHPPLLYGYIPGIKDTFLLNGDDGNITISNFRVLYWLNAAAAIHHACVFSTANGGKWDWRLFRGSADDDLYVRHCFVDMAGRADDGSLYFGLTVPSGLLSSRIIALDNTSFVLSRVYLPTRLLDMASSFSSSTFTLVHVAGGVIGPTYPERTSIVHVRGEELELFRQVHGSGEWVLEHNIPSLSVATRDTRDLSICEENCMEWTTMVGVVADGAAFAVLSACSLNRYPTRRRWFFSFNVNTMELRELPQELYRDTMKIFNYTLPWPQFLQACPCS